MDANTKKLIEKLNNKIYQTFYSQIYTTKPEYELNLIEQTVTMHFRFPYLHKFNFISKRKIENCYIEINCFDYRFFTYYVG